MAEPLFLQGFLSKKGVFWRGETAKLYLLELDRTVILSNAPLSRAAAITRRYLLRPNGSAVAVGVQRDG